jgi:hypothetical protein
LFVVFDTERLDNSIIYVFIRGYLSSGYRRMQFESQKSGQERQVALHSQEIEYALILHRMINAVREDPEQMRSTIYEFARARLKIDTFAKDEGERARLSMALETAIQGVEQFVVRREDHLPPSTSYPQIASDALATSSAAPAEPAPLVVAQRTITPARTDIYIPDRGYPRAEADFRWERHPPLASRQSGFRVAFLLLIAAAILLYFQQGLPALRYGLAWWISPESTVPVASLAQQAAPSAPPTNSAKPTVANTPSEPSLAIPSNYGVYALENDVLSELYALPERVPDKRIAVSTPIERPSRTTLAEGKAKFIVYRRDLASDAPDRMEIRVVARVARAISFDTKGRPNIASITDAWNIRNSSFELRVRPVPGNPEMLLVQSDKPDFALPAGRYVLVLKDQGYDFTIAGKVTEPAQCLERTDAANGSFYSECLTP